MTSKIVGKDYSHKDFCSEDFVGIVFESCNFRSSTFTLCSLNSVSFSNCNFENVTFQTCNLRCAKFIECNMKKVGLMGSDFAGVILVDTELEDVRTNETTCFFALQCPEVGSFVAFKKCLAYHNCRNCQAIVKLLVPARAKRSSATSRKCRCSEAKVLSIHEIETGKKINMAYSMRFNGIVYRVGKTVKVDNFDEDRWNECSAGIHFFMTKQEAIQYHY